jgi:hypothetical protein
MSQIEITPALLSDLRQKAEAYDSKEWVVDDQNVMAGFGYNTEFIAETIAKPDAEYIAAANPAVVLALVAEIERLNFALDELLCQFDYQNNPKWRAEMKEAMIEMAKKKQDMRQLSGNETNFVSKSEVKE